MCPVSRYFTAVLPVLAAVVQASGQDTNVLAESLDRTQNGMCRLDAPNIRRLVEEYNNNKNWVALKRGLTAILDLSSKAYKQLRSVDYSNYPFYDVGYKRYNELAELLVTYGGALNVSDSYGDTILHGAAAAGDLAAVEWLQARGANIEALDKDRWTPLMCAAAWGQLDVVKHLVEAGVSTTTKHKDNWTAYDWARTRRHPAVEATMANAFIVLLLLMLRVLSRGCCRQDHISAESSNITKCPLPQGRRRIWRKVHEFNKTDDWLPVKMYLKEILDHDSAAYKQMSYFPYYIFYPMYWVGLKGLTELLVTCGGAVNVASRNGNAVLHGAASRGDVQMTRWLLDHGADIEGGHEVGWTPIMHAANGGKLEVVKLLVQAGANYTVETTHHASVLKIATTGKHPEVVEYLTSLIDGNQTIANQVA